jgi:hypothetical protein
MTRWATLAIGVLAFCSFPMTGEAQAQSGAGWITLFDGKNLDHWLTATPISRSMTARSWPRTRRTPRPRPS